jgi:hypothetical protein
MKPERPATIDEVTAEPSDFSLILGGPLYQIFRRAHLTGDALELLMRRVVFITLFAWLPLLLLSLIEGTAWGSGVQVPFLKDVDTQVRFLFALPLLIVAELVVHQRMRRVVGQFLERGLIAEEARAELDAALGKALRLRNSVVAELALLAFVYGIGVMFIWRTQSALVAASWYGPTVDGHWKPSLAGWWFGCVSLPLFQFMLLRWYFRLIIWTRLLWHLTRIGLRFMPTHPDRCGGIGFLSNVCFAFTPLLVAQGSLLSGMIANQIFFAGKNLLQFKVEIAVLTGAMLLGVLGPLLIFIPALSRAKRKGLMEYGVLAQRYAREFDQKWLRGGAPADEPLLGSGDIQSLADLGNSFEVIRTMRMVPFTKEAVFYLAVTTLLPLLPLTLTLISFEELLDRFLKVVF